MIRNRGKFIRIRIRGAVPDLGLQALGKKKKEPVDFGT